VGCKRRHWAPGPSRACAASCSDYDLTDASSPLTMQRDPRRRPASAFVLVCIARKGTPPILSGFGASDRGRSTFPSHSGPSMSPSSISREPAVLDHYVDECLIVALTDTTGISGTGDRPAQNFSPGPHTPPSSREKRRRTVHAEHQDVGSTPADQSPDAPLRGPLAWKRIATRPGACFLRFSHVAPPR
jgi:hypothetical protein